MDLNHRPLGYEPNELPDCSTPHLNSSVVPTLRQSHRVYKSCDRAGLAVIIRSMAKAIWEGAVLADSNQTVEIEGNQYFPPEAVRRELLLPSDQHTVCPWKGTASYYDVVVDGKRNPNAAWYYPDPKSGASQIKDHVAFWRGVRVEK